MIRPARTKDAKEIASLVLVVLKEMELPFVKEVIAADAARTHFEIKYLERGELCQQLIISKPERYVTRFDDFQPLQGQNATVAE